MASTLTATANLKRPAAGAWPLGLGDDALTASAAKRPRTTADSAGTAMPAVDAAALSQKIVDLEAAVATGKAREAVQGRRIAALEAENATLRLRPRLPEPPAALQQLVRALGARERDLRDLVFELACMPRYLAKSARDLPPDPAGVLGTFAVTVPSGTIAIAGDAFRDCAGLAQVTLPGTVTVIEADAEGAHSGAFRDVLPCARSRCRSTSPRLESGPSPGARP